MVDYDFAIVKATGNPQGFAWDYTNPYMEQQANEAWNRCGKLGLYHFTYGLDDPNIEADFFVNTVRGWIGRAVLVIDYEGENALRHGRDWVRRFAERIASTAGVKPVIYASGGVIVEQGLKSLGYPIWCANYYQGYKAIHGYDTSGCKIYGGCEDSAIWQFTSQGYLPGYNIPLDLNICYADWGELLGKVVHVDRIGKMVQCAIDIANKDWHGYSQADRWDRDFDCSSLMYICARFAGYAIGAGRDAVRYTGTMRADFTRAGFEAIPFRNVGLGGLRRGDILLNEVHHTEIYIGDGKFAGAHSDWDGAPGDSSGQEISIVPAYDYPWDYVLRPPVDPQPEPEPEPEPEVIELQPVTNIGGEVHRLYRSGSHILTTSEDERNELTKRGWTYEGVAFTAPKGGVAPVYRMAKGGDHVFTCAFEEAQALQDKGWVYEGVPFFGAENGTAVYRLWKQGRHLFTADKREYDELKKKGWTQEGVAWRV